MQCVLCPLAATQGALCGAHARRIVTCGTAAEQIASRSATTTGAFIDAWGNVHAVGRHTRIGRDVEVNELVLRHPSVSVRHATLVREGDRWILVDETSRNGTFIDDQAIGSAVLARGQRVSFGDVTLYFVPDAGIESAPPARTRCLTERMARERRTATTTLALAGDVTLELVPLGDSGLVRMQGRVVELSRNEFGLLQLLAHALAAGAFVTWQEIANQLHFHTAEATSTHARELVRRLRHKLDSSMIEAHRGRGYRLRPAATG